MGAAPVGKGGVDTARGWRCDGGRRGGRAHHAMQRGAHLCTAAVSFCPCWLAPLRFWQASVLFPPKPSK